MKRYQRSNELDLRRDRGERERDLQRDTESVERDRELGLVAGLQNVGDSDRNLSDCLWDLRESLEVHEQRSLEVGRGDIGKARESRAADASRENVKRGVVGKRPEEILGRVVPGEQEREVRRDAERLLGQEVRGTPVRETEVSGGLYDRARETVDRSLKALRDAAEKAQRVFEQAIERFTDAIQHGNEFVCRIEQALRGNERDHQRVAKQLERGVQRQKQQEKGLER